MLAETPGTLERGAYIFNGDNWVDAGVNYLPPIPFVTQYNSSHVQSIDLFVQTADVNGSGLPSIVASTRIRYWRLNPVLVPG